MTLGTCTECGQEKDLGQRKICEACRKRIQRAKQKEPAAEASEAPGATEIQETPEDWLARRIEETASKVKEYPSGWRWIKTGNPPGSQPDIKVPIKWELSDIDKSMEFRGQWGGRVV